MQKVVISYVPGKKSWIKCKEVVILHRAGFRFIVLFIKNKLCLPTPVKKEHKNVIKIFITTVSTIIINHIQQT